MITLNQIDVFLSALQKYLNQEEDLKPTGKAFQLLGPATAKDLKPRAGWNIALKTNKPWLVFESNQHCTFETLAWW